MKTILLKKSILSKRNKGYLFNEILSVLWSTCHVTAICQYFLHHQTPPALPSSFQVDFQERLATITYVKFHIMQIISHRPMVSGCKRRMARYCVTSVKWHSIVSSLSRMATVLSHHSIEWDSTSSLPSIWLNFVSPLSIMANFVSPFYRMAHHFVTTVHNGTLQYHSTERHSTVLLSPLE